MRALRTIAIVVLLAAAGSAGTYTLQWGDTLSGVARQLGVPVRALAAANGITNPHRVFAGQVLQVPGAAAPAPVAHHGAAGTHRVTRGETLGGIARRYGTTVSRLVALNGIADPDRVRAGAVLRVGADRVCPVHGAVRFIADYGMPRSGGRSHEGVDLLAPMGRPVVANVSGRLEHKVGPRGGIAYYLHGDDGDVYYGAHLNALVAGPGRVTVGQTIGTVGDSGNARGGPPHLHFEHKPRGGAPVDPYRMLVATCVRA